MVKQKHKLLVLTTILVLALTACGNKQTDDNIDNQSGAIDELVQEETSTNKDNTKPKGEKPKDNNSNNSNSSNVDYGNALDGYNIQSNSGDIKLNIESEKIVSSGRVVDTNSIGDLSYMVEYNHELQTSGGIYELNANRFMYETNTDIININLNIIDYKENGCSMGKLNGLMSKIDLLDTRNNYIQSRLYEDGDLIATWNEYYQFVQSVKQSIYNLGISDKNLEKLGDLTNILSGTLSTRLVGYNYMEDVLNSSTNNDYFIENEDNSVDEDINIEVDDEDNTEEDNSITSEIESTEEDNTVTVDDKENIESVSDNKIENNSTENTDTNSTDSEIEEDNTVTIE